MSRAPSVAVIQLVLAATGFLINFFWEMIQSLLRVGAGSSESTLNNNVRSHIEVDLLG
jgi:hypothetical protein